MSLRRRQSMVAGGSQYDTKGESNDNEQHNMRGSPEETASPSSNLTSPAHSPSSSTDEAKNNSSSFPSRRAGRQSVSFAGDCGFQNNGGTRENGGGNNLVPAADQTNVKTGSSPQVKTNYGSLVKVVSPGGYFGELA